MSSKIYQYQTILSEKRTEIKIKSSVFISYSKQIRNDNEAKEFLRTLRQKYKDASHVCYAFRLIDQVILEKSSDDGEPSNTAGKPILREIVRKDLFNTMVAVVRYFGGTQLGVPGLIEAYSMAAKDCLEISGSKIELIYSEINLKCEYGLENEIYKLAKQFGLKFSVIDDKNKFSTKIKIPLQKLKEFKSQLIPLYYITCSEE